MAADAVSGTLDALYTRFVLRDVFAKIVPGSLVLAAFSHLLGTSPFALVGEVGFLGGALLMGACWLAGYVLQEGGMKLGILKGDGGDGTKDAERYARRIRIFAQGRDRELQQLERFTIIKEATGNGSVGLGLSLLVLMTSYALRYADGVRPSTTDRVRILLVLAALAAATYALWDANKKHREKQGNWEAALEAEHSGRPMSVPLATGSAHPARTDAAAAPKDAGLAPDK